MSALSKRTLPTSAGHTPTIRRASVDLPEPLGPITPSTSPAFSANETLRRIGTGTPGGAALTASTDIWPVGFGRAMPAERAGLFSSSLDRRSYELRVLLQLFQTAITCCTGASARPTRMDAAIIMPEVILLSSTSSAP